MGSGVASVRGACHGFGATREGDLGMSSASSNRCWDPWWGWMPRAWVQRALRIVVMTASMTGVPGEESSTGLPPIELPPLAASPQARLRLKLPVGRRWGLDFGPFTGSQWPTTGDESEHRTTEYGLRLGSGWSLSPRLHLRFELPYALGRLPELRAATEGAEGATEAAPGPVTRVDGLLTLSVQF